MKPQTTIPDWINVFNLEDLHHISEIKAQLTGDYNKLSTDQSYTNFLLNLEKEIERRLQDPQQWETIFDLWLDQAKVRNAIMDAYYDQLVP